MVSSAYLRLLIFLREILILACASSSLACYMMYSVYKLNKLSDNIQTWYAPFPILIQSVVPCPFLTVASWVAYRFLRREVRWSGNPISLRFPQFFVIPQVKALVYSMYQPLVTNCFSLFLWVLVHTSLSFALIVFSLENVLNIPYQFNSNLI